MVIPFCWVKTLATRRALYLSVQWSDLHLILYTHWLPTTLIVGWNDTEVQVLLASKAWIFSHIDSTMPYLIYVSIIKNKWLMSRKRNYSTEGDSRDGGSCCEQCYLRLLRIENHEMLVSSWVWRRRASTWKLVMRIWGKVDMELHAG